MSYRYASIRAALHLGADAAIAFSPQVLLDPAARKAALLDVMHFDDVLSWLKVVGGVEGFELTPATDAAKAARRGCATHIEIHVGASEQGDLHEAELVVAAVDEQRRKNGRGGPTANLRVHANRDHNLVVALRDEGSLHEMLCEWLRSGHRSRRAGTDAFTPTLVGGVAGKVPGKLSDSPPAPSPAIERLLARRATAPTDSQNERALAEAWLDANDWARALEAADAAITLRPTWADAWISRCAALLAAKRYVDCIFTLQRVLPALSGVTREAAARAKAVFASASQAQNDLGVKLPKLANLGGDDRAAQVRAFETMVALDPTSVYARSEVASARVVDASGLREKARQRDKVGKSAIARRLALEAHTMLHELLTDISAYRADAPAAPPTAEALAIAERGGSGAKSSEACESLRRWLAERRPNCPVPPSPHFEQFLAMVYLNLGKACDIVRVSSEAEGASDVEHSLAHFERSAELDPQPTWSVFDLWHEALETHPDHIGSARKASRRAAQDKVHRKAVRAGVWGHPSQRPAHYIHGLKATPWHQARDYAPCRVLLEHYRTIRQEALELLDVDAREARHTTTSVFCSYLSQALASGDWADVGLYYNAMRNDGNASRAPATSALLCQNKELRRHATSCPFGSAYFSLLRPGTRLSPHCGPTNARLRAHLGLVVPEGDIRIRCGDEPARKWAEGEVIVFDDSFEHEVWNLTDQPRLVLIVDIWHPELDTDEKRMRALQTDDERSIYRDVVHRQVYQTTNQRGH